MESLRVRTISGVGALVVALFISFASHASVVSHVVVFGDSLSDNGNLLAATGGAFPTAPIYFYGRQTNGLVWGETLAFDLGAALSNYAIAGAQTGTGNVWDGGPFPGSPFGGLQNQIADYTGGTVDTTAMHYIWAGANNFLSFPSDPTAAITQAVTDIVTATANLVGNGVGTTRVRLINMPDLGLIPRIRAMGPLAQAQATLLTDSFNSALADGMQTAGLGSVFIFDAAGLIREIVGDPASFGMTNVTDACIDPLDPFAPGSCLADRTIDADQYLFWDDVHPTRASHLIFSERLRLVPVPAAAWLFGSGLIVLVWARRRSM